MCFFIKHQYVCGCYGAIYVRETCRYRVKPCTDCGTILDLKVRARVVYNLHTPSTVNWHAGSIKVHQPCRHHWPEYTLYGGWDDGVYYFYHEPPESSGRPSRKRKRSSWESGILIFVRRTRSNSNVAACFCITYYSWTTAQTRLGIYGDSWGLHQRFFLWVGMLTVNFETSRERF